MTASVASSVEETGKRSSACQQVQSGDSFRTVQLYSRYTIVFFEESWKYACVDENLVWCRREKKTLEICLRSSC